MLENKIKNKEHYFREQHRHIDSSYRQFVATYGHVGKATFLSYYINSGEAERFEKDYLRRQVREVKTW